MISLLITAKADINVECATTGRTALFYAASSGNQACAMLLLSAGATDNDGIALSAAEQNDDGELVELLQPQAASSPSVGLAVTDGDEVWEDEEEEDAGGKQLTVKKNEGKHSKKSDSPGSGEKKKWKKSWGHRVMSNRIGIRLRSPTAKHSQSCMTCRQRVQIAPENKGIGQCDACGVRRCFECMPLWCCNSCMGLYCADCHDIAFECDICESCFCNDCDPVVKTCEICERNYCSTCKTVEECEMCRRSVCNARQCSFCGQKHCSECMEAWGCTGIATLNSSRQIATPCTHVIYTVNMRNVT